ncbi:hypothetical protein S83_027767, partial [Arachis hypogaea]
YGELKILDLFGNMDVGLFALLAVVAQVLLTIHMLKDELNVLQYRRMDFDEFCAATLSVHQLEAVDQWEQHAHSLITHSNCFAFEEDIIDHIRTNNIIMIYNGAGLVGDLVNLMCQFGAAELHDVAALVGGIASQQTNENKLTYFEIVRFLRRHKNASCFHLLL